MSRGFGCGKGRILNSNYSSAFICGVCQQYEVAKMMSDAIGICIKENKSNQNGAPDKKMYKTEDSQGRFEGVQMESKWTNMGQHGAKRIPKGSPKRPKWSQKAIKKPKINNVQKRSRQKP